MKLECYSGDKAYLNDGITKYESIKLEGRNYLVNFEGLAKIHAFEVLENFEDYKNEQTTLGFQEVFVKRIKDIGLVERLAHLYYETDDIGPSLRDEISENIEKNGKNKKII
jgi:hypothetical protein